MTIGEAVRIRIMDLCQQRSLNINQLSLMCGITQSTLNNIVNGRNRSTTVSTIQKICDGLGINIQEFFASDIFLSIEQEVR
ncbi:helix-turn-helix transcriptional regulator [uncultured Intestinimonas sp.]|uniref:helix-turn-helix domain-containing protein n=1 Tax=uncultured Intestinimonas sp. TaxID=1689265 RepID=UPI0025EC9C61|nr:helix-turn-helix transcriptional regulator [uncultured Intestinimonas sp.]